MLDRAVELERLVPMSIMERRSTQPSDLHPAPNAASRTSPRPGAPTGRSPPGSESLSRTVESHLSATYRKLGVRSRTELAVSREPPAATAGDMRNRQVHGGT
jgi:hypothetical protein